MDVSFRSFCFQATLRIILRGPTNDLSPRVRASASCDPSAVLTQRSARGLEGFTIES